MALTVQAEREGVWRRPGSPGFSIRPRLTGYGFRSTTFISAEKGLPAGNRDNL